MLARLLPHYVDDSAVVVVEGGVPVAEWVRAVTGCGGKAAAVPS